VVVRELFMDASLNIKPYSNEFFLLHKFSTFAKNIIDYSLV